MGPAGRRELMFGYLLTFSEGDAPTPAIAVPGEASCVVAEGDGFSFIGWGEREGGDINVLEEENGNLLILQGYVTAGPGLTSFRSRRGLAQQLKAQIEKAGDLKKLGSFVRELNGAFSILYIDLAARSVLVFCDRLATRPVWSASAGGTLHLSSHSLAICQAGGFQDYDLATLASVFLYGASMDPRRALFRNVSSQPPATVARYWPGGVVEQSSYYQFRHVPETGRSRSDWTREVAERLRAAAGRATSAWGSSLVFLSGGVDSRIAASALTSTGAALRCVTIGDGENLETRVARKVARALGAPHELHIRDRYSYLRRLDRAIFESGGRYRWRHSHFSEAYRAALEKEPESVAYLGDFAEAFSKLLCEVPPTNSPFSSEEFLREFDRLPLKSYRPVARGVTLRLFQPDVARQAEAELAESIRARFVSLAQAADDRKIQTDLFFRWVDASTQPTFQMFLDVRSAGPERNLMFDTEVQSVLEKLPSSIRDSTGFGAAVMAALHAHAGRVVDANTMVPLTAPRPLHRLSRRVRPLLGKTRRVLGWNTYRTTASWSLLTRLYTSDQEWREQFESVLFDEQLFDSRIFNRSEIAASWQRFVDGEQKHYQDLEALLSLGIIQKCALAGGQSTSRTLQTSR